MSITQYWRFVMAAMLVLLWSSCRKACPGRLSARYRRMEGDEMQPVRATITAPLLETIDSL